MWRAAAYRDPKVRLPLNTPPARAGLTWVAVALLASACGDAQVLRASGDNNNSSNNNTNVANFSDHLVEDFDNQRLVDSVSGAAVLDVNQGVLTLPITPIPNVDGQGLQMLEGRVDHDGLVEAESVVVAESGVVEATNALELRALDLVRVSGTIRAGTGGVTITAGKAVYVDGVIESRGPVRILVGSPEGKLQVSGRITVLASKDDANSLPPDIELTGRGEVEILGQVSSHAEIGRTGGSVRVRVYGAVLVAGYDARVLATAETRGTAGLIRIRSESTVTVEDGGGVGVALANGTDTETLGGDVELQGTAIRLSGASVVAGSGAITGGSIFMVARDTLAVDNYARVKAGAGPEAGSLILKAARIGVGTNSVIQGGRAGYASGLFRIEASERVDLGDSIVRAGDTACGAGGDVQIAVSGLVRTRDGTVVQGGAGSAAFWSAACTHSAAGGNIVVQAREGEGLEDGLLGGAGVPDGEVRLELNPELTVPPPSLTVGTSGRVVSKVIDRGLAAVGQVPLLVGSEARLPEGTSAVIELAGASNLAEPFEDWVAADDPAALVALANAQYLRYRVTLTGRVFDAPELDYFELDLSPED